MTGRLNKGWSFKQPLDPTVRSERVWYQAAEYGEQGKSHYGGLVFRRRAPDRAGQVSGETRTSKHSFGSLAPVHPSRCFLSTLSPSFSFTPSFVFPNTEGLNETFHRPRGACFLRGETRRKRSQPRRGQIGWGSYLGRIMFDIPHHYQLPPCRPQESYLSLADVPLSVMNFLCPPTSSPPYLSAPHLQLRGGSTGKKGVAGRLGRGEEIKKKEVIDARCHGKQNGKYNLAFSLCGDNGANAGWRHRREQTAWLVIRQEHFGAMWSAG